MSRQQEPVYEFDADREYAAMQEFIDTTHFTEPVNKDGSLPEVDDKYDDED